MGLKLLRETGGRGGLGCIQHEPGQGRRMTEADLLRMLLSVRQTQDILMRGESRDGIM
jgi:hypothetical protein